MTILEHPTAAGRTRRAVLRATCGLGAGALLLASGLRPARAEADKMRVISSQKGFWDTTLVAFGNEKGFFAQKNIDLEILWSDGGVDALQAVTTGSVDFAVAPGILGMLGAFARGAELVVTNAEMTGSSDLYWYVRADSPIRSMKDCAGKTVSYSRPGSSSELVCRALLDAADVRAKLVSTGGPGATLTQVMSGQVDVGWCAGALVLNDVKAGKVRIIAHGNDAPKLKDQTVRVGVTSKRFLTEKRDVLRRFILAQRQTIDWAYAGDEALEMYAKINKIDLETAREARDKYYPKEALALSPVGDLDFSIQQAVEARRLREPLTPEQKQEFTRHVAELTAPA